jgi:glyoxylate reductase
MGIAVKGASFGLIGFGSIAQAMVSKPHHGFGLKTFMPPPVRLIKLRLHIPCEMIEVLLPQCSFVSLRCPDDSETRHLSNERTLSETHLMIKTARAALR